MIDEFYPMEISNTAWAGAVLGYTDQPLLAALSSEALRRITNFLPQDMSNLAWSFANIGVRHSPLLQSIASAAMPRISELEPQSLTNLAWALDAMRELDSLNCFLAVATDQFMQVATSTTRTSGLSWVEISSVVATWHPTRGKELLSHFDATIGTPVLSLLRDVATVSAEEATKSVCRLSEHAQLHQLPHLGLPFTRRALTCVGVNVMAEENEFPSLAIRQEAWTVGMQFL